MGTTILLVELHMALFIADRAYVIETGKIVITGSFEELNQMAQIRGLTGGTSKVEYSERGRKEIFVLFF